MTNQEETHKNYLGEIHKGKGIDCKECSKLYEMLESGQAFGAIGDLTQGKWGTKR